MQLDPHILLATFVIEMILAMILCCRDCVLSHETDAEIIERQW